VIDRGLLLIFTRRVTMLNFIKSIFTKEFWIDESTWHPTPYCGSCNKGSCNGCDKKKTVNV
jgi:hypothetical protein